MKKQTILMLLISIVILIWLLWKHSNVIASREQISISGTNTTVAAAKSEPLVDNNTTNLPTATNKIRDWKADLQRQQERMKQTALQWRTPILYYGIVLDESNRPIEGVEVSFNTSSINEALTKEQYDSGTVKTDNRGIFKIDGVRGIGMVFQLSHPDYYPYPQDITDFDYRDYPQKGALPNTEENALAFHMHSKRHPVSLVHRADGMNVPLDGNPHALDLRGADYNQKIGQLVVEATGTPPPRYNQQPFDWGAKITVPDGGLIEYTNQFDFVAPQSGYQSSVEFSFPKETVGWTDTVSKNYFVKLPSGYARLNIYIGAKRPLFFSIEYDYNPDGSQNLERAK